MDLSVVVLTDGEPDGCARPHLERVAAAQASRAAGPAPVHVILVRESVGGLADARARDLARDLAAPHGAAVVVERVVCR